MKTEHYIKLVEKLGKEKADNIKLAMIKDKEEKARQAELEEAKLKEMVAKMIPKEDLKDGTYYNGHRWRGQHVAMWMLKRGFFYVLTSLWVISS